MTTFTQTNGQPVELNTLEELLKWIKAQYWPVEITSRGGGLWFNLEVVDGKR